MARRRHARLTRADRDSPLGATLADAREDDEWLRAFRRALAEGIVRPTPACCIGEPVSVVAVGYAGNPRRGLMARCRRPDGGEYLVSLADVGFPDGGEAARQVARYRE
jgi:hypothetical protein